MNRKPTNLFIEEILDLLSKLETCLLDLEKNFHDQELIDQVFRIMHTIKGSSSMFGFDDIAALVHEIETIFERIRTGKLQITTSLIGKTLEARDQIRCLLSPEFAKSSSSVVQNEKLITEFRAMISGRTTSPDISDLTQPPIAFEKSRAVSSWRIEFFPSEDIFSTGNNPIGLLKELCTLGECRIKLYDEGVPEIEKLDPHSFYLGWDIELNTSADENTIRDVFIFVQDHCSLKVEPYDKKNGDEGTKADISNHQDDESTSTSERSTTNDTATIKAVPENHEPGNDTDQPIAGLSQTQNQDGAQNIRVASEKLDRLVNLIGELVTAQARLNQTANQRNDPELVSISQELERLTGDLRDSALKIRMLPIGSIFNRFRRVARDIFEKSGKDAEIVLEGAETEIDKSIIERLGEALVHLIRNAIDHGIESPEKRRIKNKNCRGMICLSAKHFGRYFSVRVSDDGAGFDRQKIRARAMEKGLIREEEQLDDKDILRLICIPGFSSRSEANTSSGRGMGMSAVRKIVEDLRGSIFLETDAGTGTTFSIHLPLTLSIIEGLLLKIGGMLFVLPLATVEECIELTQKNENDTYRKNVTMVRGKIIPYIHLRELFSIEGQPPLIQQIVIATVDQQRVGFVVDQVIGELQTVIKPLGNIYRHVKGISGATILGDGTVALIIDLSTLVQEMSRQEKVKGRD